MTSNLGIISSSGINDIFLAGYRQDITAWSMPNATGVTTT